MDLNNIAQAVGWLVLATPRGNATHSKPVPPDKHMYEMTSSAFRGWRRSMEDWLKLCHITQTDAVLNIRLNCEEKLKRALDAQFSSSRWKALSVLMHLM